ncbi:sialate O-acetylesterase [uncultured Bacteroides sp.]|uniref:sialate O-acetylesterase n=1 Tax=uncultured Bacteroides sp. TaxID=162156 RepID=UPI002605EDDF|nr:sialate O-acetylesterase [uncultured Bacteroides sp.]
MKKRYLFCAILLGCAAIVSAKVKLPSLICDNMVIQQKTDVKLWGKANPGSEVSITPSWNNRTFTCKADNDGNWLIKIASPEGGFTPYEITFDDGERTTIKNVLAGEVWLASGQSNMEMPLKGFPGCCVKNGVDEAIAASDIKSVRMFNVPKKQSYEPETECEGRWMTTENPIDVMEFSATAWYYALSVSRALHLPVGIVNCSYGGASVESWTNKELLETYPDISLKKDDIENMTPWERPMLMYNAMFCPVKNYTVKGIIWYQGEANVGRHETYAQRLANMVELWRKEMGLGEIPFYYVEIAPYSYDEPRQHEKSAYLREAQFKAQSLIPNSAMVCTNDLVEPFELHNIHPRDKRTVGNRLSYLALNLTYGMKQIVCFGPQYKSVEFEGDTAYVSFDRLDMGICRNYDIRGFEVAGEDRVFYPADNVWLRWQTNHIVVSSKQVPKPVAVRYCFHDFQPGTMIGGNELPLVPFRTDNWEPENK